MKKVIMVLFVCMPVAAMAMADATPPVYGRPTLYGEYEAGARDAARAARLYGDTPRAAAIVAKTGAASARRPVKAKAAAPKKAAKKKAADKKPSPVKASPARRADVVQVPPRTVHAEKTSPAPVPEKAPYAPSPSVVAIAGAAKDRHEMRDVDSFCTRRGAPVRKSGVPGIVLMPGRPDLMSCGVK